MDTDTTSLLDKKDELKFEFEIENEAVSQYIQRLHRIIEKQRMLILRLTGKVKSNTISHDKWTQTCGHEDDSSPTEQISSQMGWKSEGTSVTDMVKEVAETAMNQTGFVYESTSGLYYDYSTGYYYNAELGLYYDGNSGTYYNFDRESNNFTVHSTSALPRHVVQKEEKNSNQILPKTEESEPPTKLFKPSKLDTELEEGECSSDTDDESDKSDTDDESDKNKKETVTDNGLIEENMSKHDDKMDCKNAIITIAKEPIYDETIRAWPPCMRIVVKETKAKNLQVGSLFIVTYSGGTLGREGDHLVLLPDVNISKYHAKFAFKYVDEMERVGNFTIVDLGSRNGTFVDGKRLSTALQESEPYPVNHESTIRVGGTLLTCHVHVDRDTCNECEPGLLIFNDKEEKQSAYTPEEKLSEKRKIELQKLKKKFGLRINNSAEETGPVEYTDRAEIRRQTKGSDSEHFKTETASVVQPIKNTNKGFKMLSKMGWSEGDSLGSNKEGGIVEPILVHQRADNVGLGYVGPVIAVSPAVMKKKKTMEKIQIRYQKLTDETASNKVTDTAETS